MSRQNHGLDADVVIVGGGMVGMALAAALKQSDFEVVVVERSIAAPRLSLGYDMRVSAIVAGTRQMLEGIGVWPHVADHAHPIVSMKVWDNQSDGGIRFSADEIDLPELGFIVENSALLEALQQTIAGADGVHMECPVEAEAATWHADHACLRLKDGRVLRTPLLVGADGGRSWLREQAGIHVYGHSYGQKAIVATVRTAQPNRRMACQRFLPTGPLAFLPLEGDYCSIVWSAEDREAERLMRLDDAAFARELFLTFGPVFGEIVEVGDRGLFPLRASLAAHLVRDRLALIGDAAHTIHPLAGLGVNLGLRDAMVLAQQLVDARRYGEDWGERSVLDRYMKQRLPDVLATLAAMEGFHRLFTSRLPGLEKLRNLGMRLVGNAGLLKKLLMLNAAGINLPVPRQIS